MSSALMSSHIMGMVSVKTPKSLSCYLIQSNCEQQAIAAMYLALAMDKATKICFLVPYEMREDPRK